MKMCEFMLLSQREQIDLLYTQGVYLGKKKRDKQTCILYQLAYFYVELQYRRYRYYIDEVRCFESTAYLDPYLQEINIEELINS